MTSTTGLRTWTVSFAGGAQARSHPIGSRPTWRSAKPPRRTWWTPASTTARCAADNIKPHDQSLELAPPLRRMLRLAARRRKILSVPPMGDARETRPRAGIFEEKQYRAVARELPDDLGVAVAIAHTYGWRIRSEVLAMERRHVDLKAGTLRLDPGTTKNKDGRIV
jgi:integrase